MFHLCECDLVGLLYLKFYLMHHQCYVLNNYFLHQLKIYLSNQVHLIVQERIVMHLWMLIHHYIFANQRELYYLHMRLLYQLGGLNLYLRDLVDQVHLEVLKDLEVLEFFDYLEDL